MSSDYYLELAGLPGPTELTSMPPGLDSSHAAFVSPTRVANQRGAAMYFEHARFTVHTGKSGNNIDMEVDRVFAGGRTIGFQSTRMVPDLSSLSPSEPSELRALEIEQSPWRFRSSESPAHAFAEFSWRWEETRSQPLAFQSTDRIYLTAFVADEPLFYPLNETDLRTLDGHSTDALKIAQAGTHIWGTLAAAIDGYNGGLSLALNDHSKGQGLPIGYRTRFITRVLGLLETDPSFADAPGWYPIPKIDFLGTYTPTIEFLR